jgi:hypothetical protein
MMPAPLAERASFFSDEFLAMREYDTCQYPLKRPNLADSQNIAGRLWSVIVVDSSLI